MTSHSRSFSSFKLCHINTVQPKYDHCYFKIPGRHEIAAVLRNFSLRPWRFLVQRLPTFQVPVTALTWDRNTWHKLWAVSAQQKLAQGDRKCSESATNPTQHALSLIGTMRKTQHRLSTLLICRHLLQHADQLRECPVQLVQQRVQECCGQTLIWRHHLPHMTLEQTWWTRLCRNSKRVK
jgi:hypothetical protein